MSAILIYAQTMRLVVRRYSNISERRLLEFNNKLPQLRQLLSCVVCRNLVIDPYMPKDGRCQHNVCRLCVRGVKSLQPRCEFCKDCRDFKTYEENRKLACLMLCFKGMCEDLMESPIFERLAGYRPKYVSSSTTPTVLLPNKTMQDFIIEGAAYDDEFNTFNADLPPPKITRFENFPLSIPAETPPTTAATTPDLYEMNRLPDWADSMHSLSVMEMEAAATPDLDELPPLQQPATSKISSNRFSTVQQQEQQQQERLHHEVDQFQQALSAPILIRPEPITSTAAGDEKRDNVANWVKGIDLSGAVQISTFTELTNTSTENSFNSPPLRTATNVVTSTPNTKTTNVARSSTAFNRNFEPISMNKNLQRIQEPEVTYINTQPASILEDKMAYKLKHMKGVSEEHHKKELENIPINESFENVTRKNKDNTPKQITSESEDDNDKVCATNLENSPVSTKRKHNTLEEYDKAPKYEASSKTDHTQKESEMHRNEQYTDKMAGVADSNDRKYIKHNITHSVSKKEATSKQVVVPCECVEHHKKECSDNMSDVNVTREFNHFESDKLQMTQRSPKKVKDNESTNKWINVTKELEQLLNMPSSVNVENSPTAAKPKHLLTEIGMKAVASNKSKQVVNKIEKKQQDNNSENIKLVNKPKNVANESQSLCTQNTVKSNLSAETVRSTESSDNVANSSESNPSSSNMSKPVNDPTNLNMSPMTLRRKKRKMSKVGKNVTQIEPKAKKGKTDKAKGGTTHKCRCGTTSIPGKLTCRGRRCPCYASQLGCVNCSCNGCKNPWTPSNKKTSRSPSPTNQNRKIEYRTINDNNFFGSNYVKPVRPSEFLPVLTYDKTVGYQIVHLYNSNGIPMDPLKLGLERIQITDTKGEDQIVCILPENGRLPFPINLDSFGSITQCKSNSPFGSKGINFITLNTISSDGFTAKDSMVATSKTTSSYPPKGTKVITLNAINNGTTTATTTTTTKRSVTTSSAMSKHYYETPIQQLSKSDIKICQVFKIHYRVQLRCMYVKKLKFI